MLVDAVAGLSFDVADDGTQACVVGVAASTAARTHHVVVMDGFARHVGVFATRKVQALDRSKVGQDIERPEDRGPSDPEPARMRRIDEVGRGEMAFPTDDEVHDRASGGRGSVPGTAECGVDWGRRPVHGRNDTQYQYGCP